MDILLVCSLAECIAVINVGHVLQHLPNLFRELHIGSRKADGNLHLRKLVIVSTYVTETTVEKKKKKHTYGSDTFYYTEDRRCSCSRV